MPRDPAKPASYYLKTARLYDREILGAIKLNSSAVLQFIADRHLRVARALYSAGAAISDCQVHLAAASDYFIKFLSESLKRPIAGIPDTESYVENISAAYLTGSVRPCVQAFRAARIQNVPRWQGAVLSLVAAVLKGDDELPEDFDVQGAPAEWAPRFTDMFVAALRRDHRAFPNALETYIRQYWAPSADRAARGDLKARPPCYVGRWAFHTAALCKLMGGVPPLSKKVLQYVPAELVGAAFAQASGREAAKKGAN
jgi:hypothetical protein